ncbi:MAG: RNA pseudouridine synthase [Candidatus Moranbacteria bacterium]|nr:RNA pseudouridine synthase [Candidatus Moranbacteria bacterium]
MQDKATEKPKIIYQDKDIIVIDKLQGLQVHWDNKNKSNTLVDWLIKEYPGIKKVGEDPLRPGIVHRLDKDTGGLMLLVKNQKAFFYYKNLFKKRKVKKIYWTLVHGNISKDSGSIKASIGNSYNNTVKRSCAAYAKNKKEALTFYKVLKRFKQIESKSKVHYYCLCQVNLKTGRTHQIRVHFHHLGHPVVGDKLYKFKRKKIPENLKNIFLISKKLEFQDRKGVSRSFEIRISDDLKAVLESLEEK